MQLEEFLELKNTHIANVISNLKAKISLYPTDYLLVVGSLAEGLANEKSDLDLLLFTERTTGLPESEHIVWVDGKCLVDVRVIQSEKIKELLLRFTDWCAQDWELMQASKFDIDDRTILHRIVNGIHIVHSEDCKNIYQVPQKKDLAKLKLNIARQDARTIFVDMMGYQRIGDYRSLVFAASEILGRAIDSLLSGNLITNPLVKWRARFIESLPNEWNKDFIGLASELNCANYIWNISRIPEHLDKESALNFAHRIVSFAKRVFIHTENVLINGNFSFEYKIVRDNPNSEKMPQLNFDTELFINQKGYYISLLNEFDEPSQLSVEQAKVAYLCDQTFSIEQVAKIVFGDKSSQNNVKTILEDFRAKQYCS